MNESYRCPRCGGNLAPGTAPEACPKCLIGIGLEKTEPGGETRTSHGVPRWNAPAPDEIAADFPQLEILELLGQGGMGVVYKARQKSLDRLVALKILAVPSDAGPAFAERFAREARALASLSHPSIVTVYDFGEAGGLYFLSMEYVDGANLHELIHDGEVTPDQALRSGDADLRRAAVRTRLGRRAPRHQAREHPRRPAGPREDRRLRTGQHHGQVHRRATPDRRRAGDGNGALHGAGADREAAGSGSPRRHLLARRGVLRVADRRVAAGSLRAAVEEDRQSTCASTRSY